MALGDEFVLFLILIHHFSDILISINEHEYDYAVGTMFTDLINECEKLGDYVVNVVEARLGK